MIDDTNRVVSNAQVNVKLDSQLIASGSTDKNGAFGFVIPAPEVDQFSEHYKDSFKRYSRYLMSFSAFVGVIFGLMVFWTMNLILEKKEKSLMANTSIVMKLLPSDHRKIITKLLENNGRIRQYELVNLTGINKIKIHRIIRDLEEDNIIVKERIGKINNLMLNKEIFDGLKGESIKSNEN